MTGQNLRTLQQLRSSGPPKFFDTDPVSIKARLVAKFESETKKALFEGQPEMFQIETMAYSLSVKSEAEQNAVLQNTIVWSSGTHVENNAANVSIFRLLAQPARTTFRFSIEAARSIPVNIAKGTRIEGGGLQFKSDKDAVIAAGTLFADVPASAVKEGRAADGIAAFAVNTPVDTLPGGVTGHNITVTFGGADIEDIERLRERAANGNFRISKGGPRNGYREIVKGLHPDIVDVGVIKPQPGYIDIYPLMKTGLPSQEIKNFVLTNIDPEDDTPMGDYISVKDMTPVAFNFTLKVRVDSADATMEDRARAKTQEIFHNWAQTAGVRVAPSVITTEVRQFAGVVDAETDGLDFTDLGRNQFAVLGTLIVQVVVAPDG